MRATWFFQIIYLVGFILLPSSSLGETLVDRMDVATEAKAGTLFVDNVSTLSTTKSDIQATQLQGSRQTKITGSPGTGNQDNINYVVDIKDQALGFIVPLGGAAFGFDRVSSSRVVDSESERTSRSNIESFRDIYYKAHFIIDLTSTTRAAFTYKYLTSESYVWGDFFLDRSDGTDYKGFLAGYAARFYYTGSGFEIGLNYAPALSGKSEIEGEDKILTTPGYTGAIIYIPTSNGLGFGLKGKRWFYKRDDRGELSTSPVDQRTISLNGLDFDQFLFKTERYSAGVDFAVSKQLTLLGTIFKQDGVFLFRGDSVPGDQVGNETAVSYNGLNAGLIYDAKSVLLKAGLSKIERDVSSVRDTNANRSWLGHRSYEDYSSQEDYIYFGFGFGY